MRERERYLEMCFAFEIWSVMGLVCFGLYREEKRFLIGWFWLCADCQRGWEIFEIEGLRECFF